MLPPPGTITWPPTVAISGRSWGPAGFQMEYSAVFQMESSQLPGGLHVMSIAFVTWEPHQQIDKLLQPCFVILFRLQSFRLFGAILWSIF
jgi:hypothetical protein